MVDHNDRDDACRCTRETRVPCKNDVPGARSWEMPEETEERKWIAYLMRCRPRILSAAERLILIGLYAIADDTRRSTCDEIAEEMGLGAPGTIHRIEAEALEKIGYKREKPDRRRRA